MTAPEANEAERHRIDAVTLAVAEERERIARAIDIVVIRRLRDDALRLQATTTLLDARPASRIASVVDDLDQIITDVRDLIFRFAGPASS